jgi:imidazolonepropionase-like amidohydrolase
MPQRACSPLAALAALAACHATPAPPRPAVVAIVGGTVVHPERDGAAAEEPGATVVIEGDRIVSVGRGPAPAGATVVDATGKWVIAGLVDSHVHFFQSGNLYTRPDVVDLTRWVSYARETQRNQARLPATFKVWLASGVTSVVDVGGPMWNFDVRAAAERTPAAPRVEVAGPLVSMVSRAELDLGDPPIIKVTSTTEAEALVRRELARRPDFVKVWFIHQPGDDLAAQEAIVKTAGDLAHAAGTRLAVHATELQTAKAALRAGADVLVHSVVDEPVDDEFLALAQKRSVIYIPTLFVFPGYRLALSGTWTPTDAERRRADPEILGAMHDLAKHPAEELPPRIAQLMRNPPGASPPPAAMANLRKVWDAGITVAMGTDAGNIGTVHGPSVFREMALMAAAGLSPKEVLVSATINGARMLGLDRDLGRVEAGRLADLVILDADPLVSVDHLEKIHRVVRAGRVYDPDELLRSLP